MLLRVAVRELLAAGPPPLPDELRADLQRLLVASNDTARTLHAGKQESARAAADGREEKGGPPWQ